MPLGGGKYDAVVEMAREQTKARGVLLIVIHGDKGHGFSVAAPADVLMLLPGILRNVADGIEAEYRAATN